MRNPSTPQPILPENPCELRSERRYVRNRRNCEGIYLDSEESLAFKQEKASFYSLLLGGILHGRFSL